MTKLYQATYVDASGLEEMHTIRVPLDLEPDDPALLDAVDGMQYLSSASLVSMVERKPHDYEDLTSASGTPGSMVSCVLLFSIPSAGTSATGLFSFPAPGDSCFDADGFVEDPPSSLVADVIAAVSGIVTDEQGHPFVDFLYGWRSRKDVEL